MTPIAAFRGAATAPGDGKTCRDRIVPNYERGVAQCICWAIWQRALAPNSADGMIDIETVVPTPETSQSYYGLLVSCAVVDTSKGNFEPTNPPVPTRDIRMRR